MALSGVTDLSAINFNTEDQAAATPRTPAPSGDYNAEVIECSMKSVKNAPNKQYLEVVFKILDDGEHKDKRLWDRFNLVHSKAETVQIAKGQLTNLCQSCGHQGPLPDAAMLIGMRCKAEVSYIPAKGAFKPKNEIEIYKPCDERFATNQQPMAQASQTVASDGVQATTSDGAAAAWET